MLTARYKGSFLGLFEWSGCQYHELSLKIQNKMDNILQNSGKNEQNTAQGYSIRLPDEIVQLVRGGGGQVSVFTNFIFLRF